MTISKSASLRTIGTVIALASPAVAQSDLRAVLSVRPPEAQRQMIEQVISIQTGGQRSVLQGLWGYAERALSQHRIILVANGAHYPGPAALPFDWRHRSGAKVFILKDEASAEEIKTERKRFAEVLKACILPILKAQESAKEPPKPIAWQPEGHDRTVWQSAGSGLKYRNNSMGAATQSVHLGSGVRIFVRVAPREWSAPARTDLERRINQTSLCIRGRDGDWGLNSEGALSIWGRAQGEDMIVTNATQWFLSTGEIWAVNTSCFSEHESQIVFAKGLPMQPIDEFLEKAIAAVRAAGGGGPIGVRLGAGDLTGTFLPGEYSFERYEAVSDHIAVEAEQDAWLPYDRRVLLLHFWNALMDAYGQPPASMEAFETAAAVRPLPKPVAKP